MAWEHYTDWLAAGDLISRDQLNELRAAVEERMLALCDENTGWMGDSGTRTGMYALIDSPIVSSLTPYKLRGAENGGARMHELLLELAAEYAADADSPLRWNVSLLTTALDAFTITAEEWGEIVGSRLNAAAYWNVCRKMTQLLSIAVARLTTSGFAKSFTSVAEPPDEFPDARDGFLAAEEEAAGVTDFCQFKFEYPPAKASGKRAEHTLDVPTSDIFTAVNVWVWTYPVMSWAYRDSTEFVTATLEFDGDTASIPDVSDVGEESSIKTALGTALELSGSMVLAAQLDAYDTAAQIEAHYPNTTASVETVLAMPDFDPLALFLEPTFTHP